MFSDNDQRLGSCNMTEPMRGVTGHCMMVYSPIMVIFLFRGPCRVIYSPEMVNIMFMRPYRVIYFLTTFKVLLMGPCRVILFSDNG